MIDLWTDLLPPPVLFASSEIAPLAKTGGLADASASLAAALADRGCDLRSVMPAYRSTLAAVGHTRVVGKARLGGRDVRILEAPAGRGHGALWLVDCPALFDRPGDPYRDPEGNEWPDNAERFACLSRAVAWMAVHPVQGFRPEIVHLNDWTTGLAAPLLALDPRAPGVAFTLHNLQYQGLFDRGTFEHLGLPEAWWHIDGVEFHGRMSFLKAGLNFADRIVTVSPTYAREILTPEHGWGLDGLLRHRAARLTGILNGIDVELWNPATDRYLDSRYDAGRLERKAANRRALRDQLGLRHADGPVLGMVSRLASQKGIDLLLDAARQLVGLPAQLAILGSGEVRYERALAALAEAHPGEVAFRAGYDESLAHRIEAGADLFLIPSLFEPCGLNQMYSMRYGTLPVARRTGGLADTVTDPGDGADDATGFLFDEPSAAALLEAVRRGVRLWHDAAAWRAMQRTAMRRDFSWSRSADRYLDVYRRIHSDRADAP